MKYLQHRDTVLPLIGFGTWTIGDNPEKEEAEINTMLYGMDRYSMTLIDTAEMYGSGRSERVVKKVIEKTDRNKLFIIDKILPYNAKKDGYLKSCENSLNNLGIDALDLYLLHWRADVDLQEMIDEMENLVSLGLIRRWGVSNFDVDDMETLFECRDGNKCFCNQVLYNIGVRGPEYDLIPWCRKHDVLFMAYSPLFNETEKREQITKLNSFVSLADEEGLSAESLMLNFVIRSKDIVTVFKTSSIDHLDNNMKNVFKDLDQKSYKVLDSMFAPPVERQPLMKI